MKKWITLLSAMLMMAMVSSPVTAQEAVTEAQAPAEAATEAPAAEQAYEEEAIFAQWTEGAPALETLIDYVETVTDESSEDYIPQEDRIAVFDMDGTVYGELFPTYLEYYTLAWRILKDPTIQPDAEMLEVGRLLRDNALTGDFPEDMPMRHAIQAARAYSGMTLDEFSDFATEILLRDVDGFEGMTYAEAFYQPIIEVVDYLRENDFKVYIVTGSDRFLSRILVEGVLDIPYENVIGMDVAVAATHQNGADGLDYVYEGDDEVIRTDQLLIKNLKMNKVCQIVQEIGRQPVLSFGNSSGDVSMHMYTISNNKYKSAAFMLVADDDVRDYGKPEKAAELREKWEASGFNVISMKNDFKTIYGEDVVKTGSFRWMEELADDRGEGAEVFTSDALERAAKEAGDPAQEEEAAASSEDTDEQTDEIQYVMYLGTNSKDTNEPVFEKEECREKAEQILIDMTGGYTIQEAEGGWLDENGNKCQEYTMVIYLSDISEDKVHEIADVMLSEFNQNSVMIQANPTSTEFYSAE